MRDIKYLKKTVIENDVPFHIFLLPIFEKYYKHIFEYVA